MTTQPEINVRIYVRSEDGSVADDEETFGLETFAGVLPSIGDTILDPGVFAHLDRTLPESRTVWKVVDRVFNPRDLANYVVLVVEERSATRQDTWAY